MTSVLTLSDLMAFDGQKGEFDKYRVLRRGDDLPDTLTVTPAPDGSQRNTSVSFALGFYREKDWLFRYFSEFQPKTYAALMQASDLYLLLHQDEFLNPGTWKPLDYFIESTGQLFRLDLSDIIPYEAEIEQPYFSPYAGPGGPRFESACEEMGSALAHCWAGNILVIQPAKRLPRHPLRNISNQLSTRLLLEKHGEKALEKKDAAAAKLLKREFAELERLFPCFKAERSVWNKHKMSGLSRSLRCFTSSGLEDVIMQCPSDVAGIENSDSVLRNEDGQPYFFRVIGENLNEWYRIDDPANAIDEATAHMLSHPDETFDLRPYCSPFG